MRTWKTFDVSQRVKFCEEHKKYFKEKVEYILKSGVRCIQPTRLNMLLRMSSMCTKCRWETLFGK